MANEYQTKLFKLARKHLKEIEKCTLTKDKEGMQIAFHKFESLFELIEELGYLTKYNEWLKERAEVEKQLAELPKSYVYINKDDIVGETEKAYKVYDGNNGYISRALYREYHKWIPKSVCKVIDGEIYAPFWATK